MIEFGKELKAAREAKGLSITDIAQSTHMMSAMIEDLENENFSRIVAPIYGRGFVKLYCEAVGLEPKTYIAEFMDIYNGNRDPAIRERPIATPIQHSEPEPEPKPEPEPTPEPASEPEPEVRIEAAQPNLFDPPSAWRAPEPERKVAPTVESVDAPPQQKAPPRLSRYSSPFQERMNELPDILPTLMRWGVLSIAAILILWGSIVAIRALYRATSSTSETQAPSEAPTPAAVTPMAGPRTPLTIPPLYID